jgi:hypothetical protein
MKLGDDEDEKPSQVDADDQFADADAPPKENKRASVSISRNA